MNLLIYGANGYTGKLILEYCITKGLKPSIAGRNKTEILQLAEQTGFDAFIVDLDDANLLDSVLKPFEAVVHCAGPFINTYRPMIEACMRTKTHYIDITGEIPVFEAIFRLNEELRKSGIIAIPGAGFDVVPSDCMAKYVSELTPEADELNLYLMMNGNVSKGTALTMIEHMHNGGALRKNGIITQVKLGYDVSTQVLNGKQIQFMAYPWGDVSTAFHSTSIPNIKVYMAIPSFMIKFFKISGKLPFLLKSKFLKRFLKNRINSKMDGPDENQRKNGSVTILAETKKNGKSLIKKQLDGPEGYTLTAESAIKIGIKVLNDSKLPTGFLTPSKAFGWEFVKTIDGVIITDVD